MRARCDPIDYAAVTKALGEGVPARTLYREYASTAARPYARSSWEQLIKSVRAKAKGKTYRSVGICVRTDQKYAAARNARGPDPTTDCLDEASDTHWEKQLSIKPRVLTTVADNASLRVKGGALVVCDGDERLVYEAGGRKPQAIVMTGWSGFVTIEAMRWACDQKVSIVVLDWMRDFLTIVAPPAKTNAAFIRAQVCADPIAVARFIVAVKITTLVRVKALSKEMAAPFLRNITDAHSVRDIMVQEAQAARVVWPNVPPIMWRVGSPRIPASWKLPYSLRRRSEGISPRNATHPVNALLNVAFSVAAGRITAQLAACGFSPAIGFLHSDCCCPLKTGHGLPV